MHRSLRFASRTAWLGLVLVLACGPSGEKASQPEGPAASADAGEVAGKIGGKPVTVGDIDSWIMEKLFENATGDRNPTRLFELRRRALEQMAGERALDAEAEKEGTQPEDLLRSEVEKRASVSDEDVQKFYDAHKDRYGNRTFEQLAPAIRRQLEQQKRQHAVEEYVSSLRDAAGFENLLEPPRFEIPGTGPSLGPEDAPVTLVEFSDYQCPFCKSVEPVLQQVLARYPTQVRFVYRNFPLDQIHPQARGAALAAMCAADQGKFWEYHKLLFEKAPQLGEDQLKAYAAQLGLDSGKFDSCLSSGDHAQQLKADVEAGKQVGVAGTPSFYVNGMAVSARTADQFYEAIDGELRRLGKPVPAAPEPSPTAANATAAPAPAQPAAAQPAQPAGSGGAPAKP